MNPKHIEKALAHDIDVAWIIALWIHIHGGDPGPEENQLTSLLAESLVTQLRERFPNLSQDPLATLKKLNALGIQVKGRTPDKQEFELQDQNDIRKFGEALSVEGRYLGPHWDCFGVKGFGLVCIWRSLVPLRELPDA
jgi:hypothetical protein